MAQVVLGKGEFGQYLSINLGFGIGVTMGIHAAGGISGKTLEHNLYVSKGPGARGSRSACRAVVDGTAWWSSGLSCKKCNPSAPEKSRTGVMNRSCHGVSLVIQ